MAATYEQVIEALRIADSQGNVEDATKLAEMAAALRPQGAGAGRGQLGGPAARPASSMGEYLGISAARGLTGTLARLASGSAMQQGTFAGAFPTQPELEEVTTENVQRRFGIDTTTRPATKTQRYIGAGVEGAFDPLNLMGAGAGVVPKLLSAGAGGLAGMGGEFGGEVGGQVAGVPGQVLGGITFALLSGAGGLKAGQKLFGDTVEKLNIKDLNVADLADVEGVSRAQSLIKQAIEADPTLLAKLQNIEKKIQFVTGEKGALAATGLDNQVIRAKVQKLAESDLTIRSDLEKLYKELQDAVQKKSASLYPQPSAELPSGKAAIAAVETDYNQRLKAIDSQLEKQTTNLTLGNRYIGTSGLIEAPTELGKSIQNLVLAREKAARGALSPEYNSVRDQASKMGAILPAQETQDLLGTAFDLFMKDPWGRQSDLLKLVKQQSDKFKALRARVSGVEPGTTLPVTTAPDLSVGLDITSLDSLKRRVADDIRRVQNPATKDKLIILQQRVDDALGKVESNNGAVMVDFRGGKSTFGDAMQQLDLDYYNKVGVPFKDADAVQKIGSQEYAERIAPTIASSPTALDQFLRVSGDEGMPLAEKAIMSKLYNKAIGKDGFVDPVKLDKLLKTDSNNGGFSDILDRTPNLKGNLDDVLTRTQYLSELKNSIDDTAKAERVRLGQSFLMDYDNRGVEGIVASMTGSSGKGYSNKFNVDLKKLPADDQTNVIFAVRNQLVNNMIESNNPFEYLNKHKDIFVSMFGKSHFDNLAALADVSRLAKSIDIKKLPIRDAALHESSVLENMVGGVRMQQLAGIAVNQISSVFNKGFRILSLIGQKNIDESTKQAITQLLFDKEGLDKVTKASTKIFTRKGKEIDIKDVVKGVDLSNLATAFGQNILKYGYIGGATAASPSEVMEEQTQPYFIYSP
jgi:hypothetical protein